MKKLPKSYQIETTRYFLRMPNELDIPFVFSASRYEGFTDGMLWEPPAQEAELLAPLQNSIKAWEDGEGFSFTVVSKKEEQPLGRISIRKTNSENVWDVGFWTHPESQGKGIMTEALGGVLDFGFRELGAIKIEACYAIWNKESEKVLYRNGMSFVRFIEKGFEKKGQWVPENLMEIERGKWRDLKKK